MKTMEELVGEVPALAGLDAAHSSWSRAARRTLASRPASICSARATPRTRFYAIRHGSVALEIHVPAREAVIIETLHEGDLLGWSWLFPPYRWSFDARAVEPVRAIAFDGACLRGKCEADHDLGYELMRRIAQVIIERLQATGCGCWTSTASVSAA